LIGRHIFFFKSEILFPDELKYDSDFSVSKCMIAFLGHESEVNLGGGFRDLSNFPTLIQR